MRGGVRYVVCSLHADPLHVGHIDYLEGAALLGRVVAVVNNDAQVALKGRVAFMPGEERRRLVGSLRAVTAAFLSVDTDRTVCKTLRLLHSLGMADVFANGGDVGCPEACREAGLCEELGIETVFGVGGTAKVQSSSALLARAGAGA